MLCSCVRSVSSCRLLSATTACWSRSFAWEASSSLFLACDLGAKRLQLRLGRLDLELERREPLAAHQAAHVREEHEHEQDEGHRRHDVGERRPDLPGALVVRQELPTIAHALSSLSDRHRASDATTSWTSRRSFVLSAKPRRAASKRATVLSSRATVAPKSATEAAGVAPAGVFQPRGGGRGTSRSGPSGRPAVGDVVQDAQDRERDRGADADQRVGERDGHAAQGFGEPARHRLGDVRRHARVGGDEVHQLADREGEPVEGSRVARG